MKYLSVRGAIAGLALVLAACAHTPDAGPRPAPGSLHLVDAAPQRGFNYPYLLKLPAGSGPSFLLVEPNNSGKVSDDLSFHVAAAKDLANKAIGSNIAQELNLPLLVPVFPRPETDWQNYTHLLDRDTMLIATGASKRHDLQLIAMIRDARARLAAWGTPVDEKVLLTGFSASGSFVNRFTAMYPEKVAAVASGGLNGLLIIPSASLDSTPLPYPLGIADLREVAGVSFNPELWRKVPQFIYLGAEDANDAVQFDDGYSESERATVYKLLGERMQPERWERCQALYRDAGANATFRTYPAVGHWTDGKINLEIVKFFQSVTSPAH